jgi:hypothetical protein
MDPDSDPQHCLQPHIIAAFQISRLGGGGGGNDLLGWWGKMYQTENLIKIGYLIR